MKLARRTYRVLCLACSSETHTQINGGKCTDDCAVHGHCGSEMSVQYISPRRSHSYLLSISILDSNQPLKVTWFHGNVLYCVNTNRYDVGAGFKPSLYKKINLAVKLLSFCLAFLPSSALKWDWNVVECSMNANTELVLAPNQLNI